MPFDFKDRVPTKLGRVKITPENGGAAYYAIVERADEPSVAGTPLSAANLNAAQENLVYSTTDGAHTIKRVYVATNGKDTNTGNTTSVPMATVRGAIRKYAKWHKYLDIYLLDGTYTEDIGTISTDNCSLSIRSESQDMDKVTINMTVMLESHMNQLRLYNITLNMTALEQRVLSNNAGQLYAYRVRLNMPTASTSACINVYNGSSAFLSECVINSAKGAAVYGNQAMLIRAYNCTSERTVPLGFYANLGTTIEYSDTLTATERVREAAGGKCVPLVARPGAVAGNFTDLAGQHMTFDGLLIQWGVTSITPTQANTSITGVVTFPIPYAEVPTVFVTPVTTAPNLMELGVVRSGDGITDAKKQVGITLVRTNTTATSINWFAIGKGIVDE